MSNQLLQKSIFEAVKRQKDFDKMSFDDDLFDEDFLDDDEWDEEALEDEGGEKEEGDLWKGVAAALRTGDGLYEKYEMEQCLEAWYPVWERIKENVAEAYRKLELFDVDEATEFRYNFAEWLPKVVTVYFCLRRFEDAIDFCHDVKKTFAWEKERPNDYNRAIGDALYSLKRVEESDAWYENWYREEPDNFECVCSCGTYLAGRGQKEKAIGLMEEAMTGLECNYQTQDKFMQAATFFRVMEDQEKADHYQKEYDKLFRNFLTDPIKYGSQELWNF